MNLFPFMGIFQWVFTKHIFFFYLQALTGIKAYLKEKKNIYGHGCISQHKSWAAPVQFSGLSCAALLVLKSVYYVKYLYLCWFLNFKFLKESFIRLLKLLHPLWWTLEPIPVALGEGEEHQWTPTHIKVVSGVSNWPFRGCFWTVGGSACR